MTFQFTIAIIMIVITLTMKGQVKYIQDKDLGFTKEALVVIPIADKSLQSQTEVLKNELGRHSLISGICATSDIPGVMKWVTSVHYEGLSEDEKLPTMAFLNADMDFIRTFGARIIEGKNFSNADGNEPREYIINEAAVRFLGWDDPIGKQFTYQSPCTAFQIVY